MNGIFDTKIFDSRDLEIMSGKVDSKIVLGSDGTDWIDDERLSSLFAIRSRIIFLLLKIGKKIEKKILKNNLFILSIIYFYSH